MRNVSMIIMRAMRSAAILAAVMVATTCFHVSSAIAGAGEVKKVEVVKPEVVKVEVVKPEVVKPEAVKVKAASDSGVFVRNPFFVRPFFARPFFFDADNVFFGD